MTRRDTRFLRAAWLIGFAVLLWTVWSTGASKRDELPRTETTIERIEQ
jgi:hypothetical protein